MKHQAGREALRAGDAVLLFLVLAPLAALLAVSFVLREDPVYVWDFRHYWAEFQHFGALIADGSPWWAEARASIRSDDYNPTAAILLFPVYALAGGSRDVYVAAIAALFLVPVVLVAALLAARSAPGGRKAFVIAALLAMLFVPFWRPTLRGMVDVVGLLPLGGAFFLVVFRGRAHDARRLVARALAVGTLLWLAFLLRRHFAYTILALFALYAGVEAARSFAERRRPSQALTRILVSAVAVLVFLALAFLTQRDLVLRAATTDYSTLYQAYQHPFAAQLLRAVDRVGPVLTLVAGIGLVIAIRQRNGPVLASFAVAIATFLLFSRTQAMADHHFLPVAFFLFPLVALPVLSPGLDRPAADPPRGDKGPLLRGAILLVAAISFAGALFVPIAASGPFAAIARLLPEPLAPVRLERLAAYEAMARRLEELATPGQRIAMFTSGLDASDELLRVLRPSLSPFLLQTSHIADVSLFDFDQLSADIAVAFDPARTHMAPGTQDHLVLANERLLTRTGFGAAFEPTGDVFELAGGMTATILRRTRPVTAAEVDELHTAILEAFPYWRERPEFAASYYVSRRTVVPGDRYGTFTSMGSNRFVAHPGATSPTVVAFGEDPNGAPDSVRVEVTRGGEACAGADGVGVTIVNAEGQGGRRLLAPGETADLALPEPRRDITITIDNNGDPTCDTALLNFGSP